MKTFTLFFTLLFGLSISGNSQICPNNMVVNSNFSNGLNNWAQYGSVTTATVLPIQAGCIDTCLVLQATTNNNVGVSQPINFKKDSCYSICYCVEFPGSTFNSKLTVAAITPGVTVAQLLSNSFTPQQAKILDIISSTSALPPIFMCKNSFVANGWYSHLVFVNQTIGPFGSDIRIDGVCLYRDVCPAPSCDSIKADFTYASGGGNVVNFTDITTSNPGDVLSYTWDFGDPASGPNNTSTLQNPSHNFTTSASFSVCLYVSTVTTFGIICLDTICKHISVATTGFEENSLSNVSVSPNPFIDFVEISGIDMPAQFYLFDLTGRKVYETNISTHKVSIPKYISGNLFIAVINKNGNKYRVLLNRVL